MPKNLVIADTSCLLVLTKVNELNLLKAVYSRIIITPEIAKEFNQQIPDWIEIIEAKDKNYSCY